MPKKTSEQIHEEMDLGELEEDVYTEEGREELMEDDEIEGQEEAFMEGYKNSTRMAKCATCGKLLMEDTVEKEIDGKIYRFCSNSCALKFKKPYKKEFEEEPEEPEEEIEEE